MKIGLYRGLDYFNEASGRSDDPVLFEVESAEIGDVFRHDGKTYVVCMKNTVRNYAGVEEITIDPDCKGREHESYLTCPTCGRVDYDSWELADSDAEHQCGTCGAIFSFQREVEVTYSSRLVKAPVVKEI